MGNFNQIFKSLRLEHNYSQGELANQLGISRSSISMYENGNREPDLNTLEKIADYFGVDVDYLLGRSKNQVKIPLKEKSQRETVYQQLEYYLIQNSKAISYEEKKNLIKLLSS